MSANAELRVLVIEDRKSDAALIEYTLRSIWQNLTCKTVRSANEAIRQIEDERWDAVLVDFSLLGLNGIDAIRILRGKRVDVPIVMVSNTLNDLVALEALKAGADDYVRKDELGRLVKVLRQLIAVKENIRTPSAWETIADRLLQIEREISAISF